MAEKIDLLMLTLGAAAALIIASEHHGRWRRAHRHQRHRIIEGLSDIHEGLRDLHHGNREGYQDIGHGIRVIEHAIGVHPRHHMRPIHSFPRHLVMLITVLYMYD